MRVTGLDHIVLNVSDVERSLAFYSNVLGLDGERAEEWRRGEAPFPSVRINESTIIDLFQAARPGENVDHFCLVVPETDWVEMTSAGQIEIISGPTKVFGARGMGTSVYTRDPDGNTVELRRYGD
jgi:catechol 2,3-dioxygenase-like lactoylglutathione lyase family enzyme